MVAPREAVTNVDKLIASVTVTELPPAEKQLGPEDVTPPMGLMYGDRVALQNQINVLKAVVELERTRNIAEAAKNARNRVLAWVAVAVASASLIVQLTRIVTLLVMKGAAV